MDDYFPKAAKAEAKLSRPVTQLTDARAEDWSERFREDPAQDRTKTSLLARSRRREGGLSRGPAPTGDNVVSIMDALKRSVAADKGKRQDKSMKPAGPGNRISSY